jgi:hypothetical protein
MSRRALILDCETTSLWPDYPGRTGTIWELATIEYGTGRTEHVWRAEPDLAVADPGALQVNRYYEATRKMRQRDVKVHDLAGMDLSARVASWSDPALLAAEVARRLDGVTLICASPTFDAPYVSAFLTAYGQSRQPWHHRARDIGSMAWGYLNGLRHRYAGDEDAVPLPPLDASTDDFARALAVDPDSFERHSALGDCRLAAAMLDVILGRPGNG